MADVEAVRRSPICVLISEALKHLEVELPAPASVHVRGVSPFLLTDMLASIAIGCNPLTPLRESLTNAVKQIVAEVANAPLHADPDGLMVEVAFSAPPQATAATHAVDPSHTCSIGRFTRRAGIAQAPPVVAGVVCVGAIGPMDSANIPALAGPTAATTTSTTDATMAAPTLADAPTTTTTTTAPAALHMAVSRTLSPPDANVALALFDVLAACDANKTDVGRSAAEAAIALLSAADAAAAGAPLPGVGDLERFLLRANASRVDVERLTTSVVGSPIVGGGAAGGTAAAGGTGTAAGGAGATAGGGAAATADAVVVEKHRMRSTLATMRRIMGGGAVPAGSATAKPTNSDAVVASGASATATTATTTTTSNSNAATSPTTATAPAAVNDAIRAVVDRVAAAAIAGHTTTAAAAARALADALLSPRDVIRGGAPPDFWAVARQRTGPGAEIGSPGADGAVTATTATTTEPRNGGAAGATGAGGGGGGTGSGARGGRGVVGPADDADDASSSSSLETSLLPPAGGGGAAGGAGKATAPATTTSGEGAPLRSSGTYRARGGGGTGAVAAVRGAAREDDEDDGEGGALAAASAAAAALSDLGTSRGVFAQRGLWPVGAAAVNNIVMCTAPLARARGMGSSSTVEAAPALTAPDGVDIPTLPSCVSTVPSSTVERDVGGICVSVVVKRGCTVLCGRYIKLDRTIPQSPWDLSDGTPLPNLESAIGSAALVALRGSRALIHAAGREDMDVRMLGSGRPYAIQILGAVVDTPSAAALRAIADAVHAAFGARVELLPLLKAEDKVATSSGEPADEGAAATTTTIATATPAPTRVPELRLARRSVVAALQAAGEDKVKTYSAVCWSALPVTRELLRTALDTAAPFELKQLTPIRVAHRRVLATRDRAIVRVKTRWINSHWFEAELDAAAGTYVKEFVHGDFGRTEPSVVSLLRAAWVKEGVATEDEAAAASVDILQLDVLRISSLDLSSHLEPIAV